MEVQLFVFGTPKGESFWGNVPAEHSYFSTHYNSSSDRIKFLIEMRNVNGKTYYYYNYLVYTDVLDNDNRSGAFFGIALRFDEYYTDYISVYRTLDWAFNYSVVGKLLISNGNKLKYAIPAFSAADTAIRMLEKTIIERLSQTLAPTRFARLPIGPKIEDAKNLNIPEATDRQVADALQKSGKVNLSPHYPSAATANVAKQFESKIEQLNQALKNSRQENEILKKQNLSLNNNLDIAKQEALISKQKAQTLQQEINRQRDTSNLKASIEVIKNPIKQLADYFGKDTTTENENTTHNNPGRKPKQPVISFRGVVNLLYQIISLILILCIFFRDGSKKDDTKPAEEVTVFEEVTVPEEVHNDSTTQKDETVKDESGINIDIYKNGRIDIDPTYNNGVNINKNTTCNIKYELRDDNKTVVKIGEMYADGIVFQNLGDGKYSFVVPDNKNSIKIEFKINGILVNTRTLNIK